VAYRRSREMGLTRAEFLRLLPAAVGQRPYALHGDEVHVEDPAGTILIRLHPTTERRIAGLALPATRVDLVLPDLPESTRRAFLEHFDRYYQRGGG
jgi:hypothetical protein